MIQNKALVALLKRKCRLKLELVLYSEIGIQKSNSKFVLFTLLEKE